MTKKVTAIFDIGRTNKKFFLFDKDFKEVYREYIRFDEIVDEEGYPTDDLQALEVWAKEVFDRMMNAPEYDIETLNFSCYGATVVHIDEHGKALTPLYNYMKPLEDRISASFYKKYGPEDEFSRLTGSPKLGMLNTGMHMYWLKYAKPSVFKKIKYTLHLPQYLSYLFSGIPVSEYTSIGCHTMLWDYEKQAYHDWVYQEEIDKILPPFVAAETTTTIEYNGKPLKVGVGLHDSSSALLPYVRSIKSPFLLVSTGTWSISVNPFTKGMLTLKDVKNKCLFNMRIDGSPTKASRLFLGNEYKLQVKVLSAHFNVPEDYHKTVKFDQDTFFEINKDFEYLFRWKSITDVKMAKETKIPFDQFEHAYHQLMLELVLLQVENIKVAIGDEPLQKLFVDGGFSDNDVYIKLLSHYLRPMELRTTDSSLGSALGAAIVISDSNLKPKFLKKNYALKKHRPLILK
ncbi:MAG: carbohydrate kinase [Maribacter sp.]|nr:carbohydrate kinase [Maribacter sp.]